MTDSRRQSHHTRITSAANPRVRAALRLRDRRERDRAGLTLVDGVRETARALAGGAVVREVFVSSHGDADDERQQLMGTLDATSITLWQLGPAAFARLSYGDRQDSVITVAQIPRHSLADLELPDEPLLAVIEGVEKPGNLGAILRSADGAGVDGVIVADSGTDLFNPNVIRASLGTVFSVPVAVASSGEVLAWLRERSIAIVAARVEAAVDYTAADYRGALAIALGSEARGLSDAWAELADTSVHVPMLGVADSLNVSATAAILFYEALRQRRGAAAADAG